MVATSDTVRVALLALLTGVVLPLLVQLFLTLRSLRSAAESIERRLNELAVDVKSQIGGPSTSLGATIGAALPAVLAAVHAFRVSMHAHDGDDAPAAVHQVNNHGQKESSHESR